MTEGKTSKARPIFDSPHSRLTAGGLVWLLLSIMFAGYVFWLFTDAALAGNKLFDPFGTTVHKRQSQGVYHK